MQFPAWLEWDVSLPRSREAQGKYGPRGDGAACSHHLIAHEKKKIESKAPGFPPGTFFSAACRWGRVAAEKGLVEGRVWMHDPLTAAKEAKPSMEAKLEPPTIRFDVDDASSGDAAPKPDVMKSREVVAVVASPLSDTSLLVVGAEESILVVFLSPVLVDHFTAAAAHLIRNGPGARLWKAHLSLGRHLDLLTLCAAAKRRHALADLSKAGDALHPAPPPDPAGGPAKDPAALGARFPPAAAALRDDGELYIHALVACAPAAKQKAGLAAKLRTPKGKGAGKADAGGDDWQHWLAVCDRGVYQGVGHAVSASVRYSQIRSIALVQDEQNPAHRRIQIQTQGDEAVDFGPFLDAMQPRVLAAMELAFSTELCAHFPSVAGGRRGVVPTPNPCPLDGGSLGWLRYLLAHRLFRLVDIVAKLPEHDWGVLARGLVRACSAEGRMPQLLAEVMALEVRTAGTLENFLHGTSIASLTVAHYMGYALDEWAHAVMRNLVEKVYENPYKLSMASKFDKDALSGFVSYIFRVIGVSDMNRTVPPELRAVLGALHYTAKAVGEGEDRKLLPLFSTYIIRRGVNRYLLQPELVGLKPTPDALENGKMVARVVEVLGNDLTFDPYSQTDYQLVWLKDWLELRKPEVIHLYTSLANPFSLPEGAVGRPGQMATVKTVESARVDGRLRDQYAAPDGLHWGLAPLMSTVQRFAMPLLIESWALEDRLAEDIQAHEETIELLRSSLL